MNKGFLSTILILLFASLTLMSFGVTEDAYATPEIQAVNETDIEIIASDPLNVTATEIESIQPAKVSAEGTWKLSLAGTDILMALNQSGENIIGHARSEGDSKLAGVITGFLSGNAVSISVAAIQGEALISAQLSGTIESDIMQGSYILSDSNGKEARGELAATMISPDISNFDPVTFTPVKVDATMNPAPDEDETKNSNEPKTSEPVIQDTSSRFKDVTVLAKGIDPNIMPRMANI